MNISVITQLIGSLGFPIACVVAMFYYWNKEREDHKSEIDNIRSALENITQDHKSEIDSIRSALENNTQALIKIEEILRKG